MTIKMAAKLHIFFTITNYIEVLFYLSDYQIKYNDVLEQAYIR